MNQHAWDILKILIFIALMSIGISAVVILLVLYYYSLSLWHGIYLVPPAAYSLYRVVIFYLRVRLNFPY